MLQASLPSHTQSFTYEALIADLKGVGPHTLRCLAKLNLVTYRDLLFHFPLRYEDRTRITSIKDIHASHKVQVQGQVEKIQVHRGRKRWLEIFLKDKTGMISLVLFHFTQKQVDILSSKPMVRCFGELSQKGGKLSLVHPEIQFIRRADDPVEETLTPIYPVTKGLYQNLLRKLISQVLNEFSLSHEPERLPNHLVNDFNLPSFKASILTIHQPRPDDCTQALLMMKHQAFQRLIVEELMAHQVALKKMRLESSKEQAMALKPPESLMHQFLEKLPFSLTGAQNRAFEALAEDLQKSSPMMRLIQGDVGSGKTVVAGLAALFAVANQTQVAVLAPTEILAEQHFQQFKAWFEPLGYDVIFLKGGIKAKQKRELLDQLDNQDTLIAVGTHALFQQTVTFKRLSLMIVDEQHRFGVHQRLQLRAKGASLVPHQLVMTATPIPRTLAMTRYRDLDLTVIDELPPGRKEITTICLPEESRGDILEKIEAIIVKGQQIYWVCPLITESEKLQIQAAEMAYEEIREKLKHPVACIHGRMKAPEKQAIMKDFIDNETKVLVATTVIEVGVNVPNATLMVIDNAERLGLAQLHQLRGRVGRGADQSFCILLYKKPLTPHAKKRLDVMRRTNDGLIIAEEDLKIRGPGEVLGARQTGLQMFKVADIFRDQTLIYRVNDFVKHKTCDFEDLTQKLSPVWIGVDVNCQTV